MWTQVLTNAAPRPPPEKFIISHDSSTLDAAIDAYLKRHQSD